MTDQLSITEHLAKQANLSAEKALFNAMSTLRIARHKMERGDDIGTIYSGTARICSMLEAAAIGISIDPPEPQPEPIELVVYRMINDALNAYDRYRRETSGIIVPPYTEDELTCPEAVE